MSLIKTVGNLGGKDCRLTVYFTVNEDFIVIDASR